MARYKYYKGYFHDLESDYYESVSDEYYNIPPNPKLIEDENGDVKFDESVKITLIPNNRKGEVLIYREGPKGKRDKKGIVAHYCEFKEHFREQIKAPKGYLKRAKRRAKLVKEHGAYGAQFYE